MRLATILKIVFGLSYVLWVAVLYMSMPPEGLWETMAVLVFAAVIFVAGYYFHLFLIRGAIGMFSKRRDGD